MVSVGRSRWRSWQAVEAVMDLLASASSEARFLAYVEGLVRVIGQAAGSLPLHVSCLGLLRRGGPRSVEPMAAVTAPARVAAQHQSLLHFVGNAPWSDERVLARCASWCCRHLN